MKPFCILLFALLFVLKVQSQTTIAAEPNYEASICNELSYYTDSDPFDPFDPFGTTYNYKVGQTFKATTSTTIATIEFYVYSAYQPGSVNVEIYSCSAQNAWGTLLGTKTNVAINGAGWVTADVSSLNISVTAGNYYGYKLIPQFGLQACVGANHNYYADGQSWVYYSSPQFFSTIDYPFKVMSNITLPVSLVSFTAKKQNGNVLLQWSTASEQNAKDFIVQHSKDGNTWKEAGTVIAAGQSNSPITYSFEHTQPIEGVNYYRLLQRDADGKSSASKIVVVNFSDELPGFTILTNPVKSGRLQIQVDKESIVDMYSSNGNLLWERKLTQGLHYIDLSSYAKGLYLLKDSDGSQKILVQ